MLWLVGSAFVAIWFVLKFILHKQGLVHILLIAGISLLVVQLVAHRKTSYQKAISRK